MKYTSIAVCRVRETLLLLAIACPSAAAQNTDDSRARGSSNVNPQTTPDASTATATGTLPTSTAEPATTGAEDRDPSADVKKTVVEWLQETGRGLGDSFRDAVNSLTSNVDEQQEATRDLREQVERLEGSVADLQKAIVELRSKMGQNDESANLPVTAPASGGIVGWHLLSFLGGGLAGLLFGRSSRSIVRGSSPTATRRTAMSPIVEERTPKARTLPLHTPAGVWPVYRGLAEETWGTVHAGAAWREEWVAVARDAMTQALASENSVDARRATAEFAATAWVRFVSQFDPDPVLWQWTSAKCAAGMPPGLHVKLGGVRPNDQYKKHAGAVTLASGEGQYISSVVFPGCVVHDDSGHTLHELGAVVVKGDAL